jgi:hypothetical protein
VVAAGIASSFEEPVGVCAHPIFVEATISEPASKMRRRRRMSIFPVTAIG